MRAAGASVTIWVYPMATTVPAATEQQEVELSLERTACYACTEWHTCLVFVTEGGLRVPLCDACLRLVVPRALSVAEWSAPEHAAGG